MDSKVKTYPISVVKTWECTGTPDYVDSISQLGVLEPIILGKTDGTLKILAGQRRVASLLKAYNDLDENGQPIPEQLKSIKAVVFEGLSETDENAITIAENEQRSANPIATWKQIQAATKRGDFDKVVALSKINKSRLKAIQRLNEVRPALIDAYDAGKISESTLMATSSLGGARQDFLLVKLQTQPRITMSDVTEAKQARTAAVLASRPMLNNVSVSIPVVVNRFVLLNDDPGMPKVFTSLQEALEAKNNSDPTLKLYRLSEIG